MTKEAAKRQICGHCAHERAKHRMGGLCLGGHLCHCSEYVSDYETFMADDEAQAALREVGLLTEAEKSAIPRTRDPARLTQLWDACRADREAIRADRDNLRRILWIVLDQLEYELEQINMYEEISDVLPR